jgi:cell wall-associated NlpC family hydrolase
MNVCLADVVEKCGRFCQKNHMVFLLLILLCLSGCMQKVDVSYIPCEPAHKARKTLLSVEPPTTQMMSHEKLSEEKASCMASLNTNIDDQLKNFFDSWQGVRYRLGGLSSKGIDCSGLTLRAYEELFGVSLPRTVIGQSKKGQRVNKQALQPGDLVFFKTGRFSRHVGIYVGENQFLHASRSSGVTVSDLDNVYWQKKFWQAKRVQTVSS